VKTGHEWRFKGRRRTGRNSKWGSIKATVYFACVSHR